MEVPNVNLFGSLLGGLLDQVNNTIQQAAEQLKNAGMELEIEAGEEISRAIEQVKNCYNAELNITIDKVSVAAKKAFDSLNTMVQRFQAGTEIDLQDLMVQAQQLANTLPFANYQPQLSSVKPRYLLIDDIAKATLVIFRGNFPYSAKKGWEPSLFFSDESCFLADSNTQALTFQVPHRVFKVDDQSQYSYKTGILKVPFDDGWIWSHRTEFDYRIGLGALPQLAGKGFVEYVAKGTERVSQHIVSSNYHYDGNSWYPAHWHEEDLHVYPASGWTIDTSKPPKIVNFRREHGKDSSATILSVASSVVVVHVKLYCRDGHDMDIFNFQVAFDQYQDIPQENKRTENFQMNWKDSKLLEPQGEEVISKVVFDDYKGVHQEYAGPNVNNTDVLQIAAEVNGKWRIWTQPPKDIGLKEQDLSKTLQEKIKTANHLQYSLPSMHMRTEFQSLVPN